MAATLQSLPDPAPGDGDGTDEELIYRHDSLAAALSVAQGQFPAVPKDSAVSFPAGGATVMFRYASLDAMLKAARPVLARHGLAVSQLIRDGSLATVLMHESGGVLESTVELGRTGDWKQFGGAVTYARRYSLAAILGIAADEDLDANVADARPAPAPARPAAAPARPAGSGSGRWTLDAKTLELSESGEGDWPDPKARLKAMFQVLRREMRPEHGVKCARIWEANAERIAELPETGRAALGKLVHDAES